MCKGPVVRGNMAPSWNGEQASVPSISGAQGHEGCGVTQNQGMQGPGLSGPFPQKSALLLRKIF